MEARFFHRDPKLVARELLGMTLVRRLDGKEYRGRIVETEAYYSSGDPASRARYGKKRYNAPMFDGAGHLFIYNVHKYWMLNFTTLPVSAVLIRAVEPLNFEADTRGPGRLTMALRIDRSLNGLPLCNSTGVWVEPGKPPQKLARSFRIGVTADLPEPLRFFDPESSWVSFPRKPVLVKVSQVEAN